MAKELSNDDIAEILGRNRRPRPTTKEKLIARAKATYPYPPNPFCSNAISLNIVREAFEEAGYKDFTLHLDRRGIFIERKRRDELMPKVELYEVFMRDPKTDDRRSILVRAESFGQAINKTLPHLFNDEIIEIHKDFEPLEK